MKGYYRHILLLAAAVMAADGCTKTHVEETPSEPMPISISAVDGAATKALLNNGTFNTTPGASAPATKAMLDGDAFKKEGNRIQVYDYVDGEFYFSDQIGPEVTGNNYGFEGVWPFVNGPHQWTPGTHKFFGWLVNDVNGTTDKADDLSPVSIFGDNFACKTETVDNVTNVNVAAFNKTTQTLTIPATTMSPTTPQFDFMYSDIFTTEPINEPVELEFSHLFCAVSFGIKNSGSDPVTINNIKVENLYSKKSADITFPADSHTASVIYSNVAQDTYINVSPNLSLASGAHSNIIYNNGWTTTASSTEEDLSTREYYLMWPQDSEDVYSEDEITYTGTGNNLQIVYPASWKISLTYTRGSLKSTIRLNFPNNEWEAGRKYHFDIAFASKVYIYYDVVEWSRVSNSITFN